MPIIRRCLKRDILIKALCSLMEKIVLVSCIACATALLGHTNNFMIVRRGIGNQMTSEVDLGRDMTFGPVKGISAQAMQGSVETGFFMNAKHVVFPVHQ